MTAKTKHGHKAHPAAHGADPGTAHERLNRAHAMPGRPEGAMMGDSSGGPMPPTMPTTQPGAMAPPPMGAPPMGGAMSMGNSTDDEEGDQS